MENLDNSSDTITLKEIVSITKEYIVEIFRKWWIMALLAIPMVGYFAYKTINTPIKYNASLRYVVEGSGGSTGGLGSLLGSFGLGSGVGGKINPWKVLEVTKSKIIMDQVLLDTSAFNNDLVINNIISEYKLDEKWGEKNPDLLGYRFKNNKIENFSELDRIAFKGVMGKVLGSTKDRSEALLVTSLHDEFGIYSLYSSSLSEELSLDISIKTYNSLKRFFEEGLLENQEKTRDVLESKKDSIKGVIDAKSYQLASLQDRSRGAVSRTLEAKESTLRTEIAGLGVAYQEVYKSFELADYNFKNSKPYFLPIDMPFTPLSKTSQSLIVNLIIALFLAGLLGSLFIVIRKFLKEALA